MAALPFTPPLYQQWHQNFSTFIMSSALAKPSSGGRLRKQRWLQVVVGMRQSPKTWKRASITIRSVLLDQKVLPFASGKVREGITAEEFQDFIDGPNGVNFGLGAWMNICREINVELAGTPPYPRKF